MVFHDIYSRQFFLTFEELAASMGGLECASILDQHVCEDSAKPDKWRESRYCYRRRRGPAEEARKRQAVREAEQAGARAVARLRATHTRRSAEGRDG